MSESTYPSVKDLTLEEKASLTSGGDAWHLQGVESKGIPGYMITDGPHGLRKSLASSAGETEYQAHPARRSLLRILVRRPVLGRS